MCEFIVSMECASPRLSWLRNMNIESFWRWAIFCRRFLLYHRMSMTSEPSIARVQAPISQRPRQNERYFADDIFKCIFFNENVWISLKISLKFVPKVPIDNIPVLVLIMAWCRQGDKPLSEPLMASVLTHICVTRPQWVNDLIIEDI